jgi:hypothetical protein
MNTRWLVLAFAGGVAVGVLVTRVSMDSPAANSQVVVENPAPTPAPPAAPATNSTVAETPAARPAIMATGITEPVSEPPAPEASAVIDQGSTAVDDASIQRIDAGPVFNEVIARPSQPGFENQLGDAHRALERETRNDGWAYAMEAEIQNALVNEVSTGEFRADHVECRATLCELRLSGKGNQAAAIKRWSESLGAQPFGQRLFVNYSSSISNNERVDSLMIFRKPAPPPTKPR